MAEGDFELPILLPPPPECWHYSAHPCAWLLFTRPSKTCRWSHTVMELKALAKSPSVCITLLLFKLGICYFHSGPGVPQGRGTCCPPKLEILTAQLLNTCMRLSPSMLVPTTGLGVLRIISTGKTKRVEE